MTVFPISMSCTRASTMTKSKPYAFDILTLDGEDLRPHPLSLRKTNLARLLARRPFSCSPGTGALRRDRARERGGRAAAWSTIYADNPTPSPFRHDSDVNQAFASSVIVGSPNGRFARHKLPFLNRSIRESLLGLCRARASRAFPQTFA